MALKPLHTFATEAYTQKYLEIFQPEDLEKLEPGLEPKLILGGGSNLLFTKNFEGVVLKNNIKGIEVVRETEEEIFVKAGGGENWHQFVMFTVAKDWGGLENLSLIPGTVGAAPIQNIGAYGVEQNNSFVCLTAFHFKTGKFRTFTKSDCCFGYRESVFKTQFRGEYFIVDVTYRLLRTPIFHVSYGAIQQQLEKSGEIINVKAVSDAVIAIRNAKLPDPAIIGNAGSFFKNPMVSASHCLHLLSVFPEMPHYTQEGGEVKLAAGWLIDQCGWKGYRKGDAGCYPLQALVLVNYGNATGKEILDLSDAIILSVQKKFKVLLEREVNVF